MAVTSYADIYVPKTQAEIEAIILGLFPAGWPINDWKPGGTERTHVEIESFLTADLYQLAALILKAGYLDSAEGDWLTILALSFFDELRDPALFTEGKAVLSLALGAANQVIAPGQLWLQTADNIRFSNTTGGLVTPAAPLTVDVRAEFAGADGNVPTGSMTVLGTPLPGMSCNNPIQPPSNTWITQWGAWVETDELLRLKCKAKWGAQGNGGPSSAYYYWARKAAIQIKKVKVFSNYLAGRAWAGGVTVYIAGDNGPVDPAIVAAARAYITERVPINSRVQVESAVALTVKVSGPVKMSPKATAADQLQVRKNVDAYSVILDIGEKIYLSEIVGAVVHPPKGLVLDFKPTAPGGDIQPYRNQITAFDTTGLVFGL